jgi:putative chitinase
MSLSAQQLLRFLPNLTNSLVWIDALNGACPRFGITSNIRMAAFLAQVAYESAEFSHLIENLNYSAPRLMQVFPKYFPTIELAREYERQPEKIANRVYANRLGNGDAASGDGWRFRGRGLIQLTGRDNYRETGAALHLPLEVAPDEVAQPNTAALTAGQFWASHSLNLLADLNTEEAFDRISRRINGGNHGLAARRAYWTRAKTALVQGAAA